MAIKRAKKKPAKAIALEKAPGRGKYDRTLKPAERVREQRRRLFSAAAHVFGTRGYAKSTVDHVCVAAGVSRRTFYDYFEDIEHLFVELHDRLSRQSFEAVERYVAAQKHPEEQLRAGVEGLLGLIARFPNESKVMFREVRGAGSKLESRRDALLARFADLLERGVARSHAMGVAKNPPDDVRVYALVAGMEAVAMRYVDRGEHERALVALPALVDLVMRAFDAAPR